MSIFGGEWEVVNIGGMSASPMGYVDGDRIRNNVDFIYLINNNAQIKLISAPVMIPIYIVNDMSRRARRTNNKIRIYGKLYNTATRHFTHVNGATPDECPTYHHNPSGTTTSLKLVRNTVLYIPPTERELRLLRRRLNIRERRRMQSQRAGMRTRSRNRPRRRLRFQIAGGGLDFDIPVAYDESLDGMYRIYVPKASTCFWKIVSNYVEENCPPHAKAFQQWWLINKMSKKSEVTKKDLDDLCNHVFKGKLNFAVVRPQGKRIYAFKTVYTTRRNNLVIYLVNVKGELATKEMEYHAVRCYTPGRANDPKPDVFMRTILEAKTKEMFARPGFVGEREPKMVYNPFTPAPEDFGIENQLGITFTRKLKDVKYRKMGGHRPAYKRMVMTLDLETRKAEAEEKSEFDVVFQAGVLFETDRRGLQQLISCRFNLLEDVKAKVPGASKQLITTTQNLVKRFQEMKSNVETQDDGDNDIMNRTLDWMFTEFKKQEPDGLKYPLQCYTFNGAFFDIYAVYGKTNHGREGKLEFRIEPCGTGKIIFCNITPTLHWYLRVYGKYDSERDNLSIQLRDMRLHLGGSLEDAGKNLSIPKELRKLSMDHELNATRQDCLERKEEIEVYLKNDVISTMYITEATNVLSIKSSGLSTYDFLSSPHLAYTSMWKHLEEEEKDLPTKRLATCFGTFSKDRAMQRCQALSTIMDRRVGPKIEVYVKYFGFVTEHWQKQIPDKQLPVDVLEICMGVNKKHSFNCMIAEELKIGDYGPEVMEHVLAFDPEKRTIRLKNYREPKINEIQPLSPQTLQKLGRYKHTVLNEHELKKYLVMCEEKVEKKPTDEESEKNLRSLAKYLRTTPNIKFVSFVNRAAAYVEQAESRLKNLEELLKRKGNPETWSREDQRQILVELDANSLYPTTLAQYPMPLARNAPYAELITPHNKREELELIEELKEGITNPKGREPLENERNWGRTPYRNYAIYSVKIRAPPGRDRFTSVIHDRVNVQCKVWSLLDREDTTNENSWEQEREGYRILSNLTIHTALLQGYIIENVAWALVFDSCYSLEGFFRTKYQKRLKYNREGNGLQLMEKNAMNSAYGKLQEKERAGKTIVVNTRNTRESDLRNCNVAENTSIDLFVQYVKCRGVSTDGYNYLMETGEKKIPVSPKQCGSAVLDAARHMMDLLFHRLGILDKPVQKIIDDGELVLYQDTDSAYVQFPLYLKTKTMDLLGKKMGQFKNDTPHCEEWAVNGIPAYFIASLATSRKMKYLVAWNGEKIELKRPTSKGIGIKDLGICPYDIAQNYLKWLNEEETTITTTRVKREFPQTNGSEGGTHFIDQLKTIGPPEFPQSYVWKVNEHLTMNLPWGHVLTKNKRLPWKKPVEQSAEMMEVSEPNTPYSGD